MNENQPGASNSRLHSPYQMSLIPGDDMPVDETALGNAEPNATEALSPSNFRSTSDFPSRAQLQRHSRESKGKRQDLLDVIHHYKEQYFLLAQERVEQFELARELKQKLEAFEESERDLDQLLSQVEEIHGEGGFWGFLKVAEPLKRMRELLLGNGARQ